MMTMSIDYKGTSAPPRADPPGAGGGRRTKKAEALARLMLERGLEGGPGLPTEAVLRSESHVGRNTVREAQRILEVHGALDINTGFGGGASVRIPGSRDFGRVASFFYRSARVRLGDLLDARLLMEPLAARLAAEQRTEDGDRRLRGLVETLERGDTSDNHGFLRAGREFHEVICGISANPVVNLFSTALVQMVVDRMAVVYPEQQRGDVTRTHVAIGRAILEGEAARAEELMRRHWLEYDSGIWGAMYAGADEVLSWR